MTTAPVKLHFKFVSAFFLAICIALLGLNVQAQSRKSSAKSSGKEKQTKQNGKDKLADKTSSKESSKEKSKKPSKAELAQRAEMERREAARRREAAEREEERRQAILAERRRREQAIREAQARQRAFENGLKSETLLNIAKDNTSGEDLEIRRAAVSALAGHAGTVVVMEAQTGKVLSIVNQDWAIRKGFKPCSTIKLVTGVAGLSENEIEENGRIRARSFPMGLDDALAHSNNSYFQKVGAGLGNSRMIEYAKDLGLGEPTGINAENESAGKLPYGNNNPRIYSHGDDFEVTPLQLAVMVSTISNGGNRIVPQIPRTSVEKANFHGVMRGRINLPQNKLEGVLPGMIGAVNYGTARRSGASEFSAAGKTGSCTGQGTWLGLFASVAPVVNPKYAVVVITRGASERGKYASAIAGKVYQALGSRIRQNGGGNEMMAKLPLQLKPQPRVNAKTSALVDNEEGEDSEEGDVNVADIKTEIVKKSNQRNNDEDVRVIFNGTGNAAPKTPANKVVKTSSVRPVAKNTELFNPVVIEVNKMSRPRVVQTNKK